jgi:hypothetical protein
MRRDLRAARRRQPLAIGLCLTLATAAVSGAALAQPSGLNGRASCDPQRVRFAVGARYSDELGRRALARAQAASLRVTRPGEVHTMEFRADRLTVDVDRKGRVRGVRCG